jgi:hypothetical protein
VASDGEERPVFGVKLSVRERRANGKNPPKGDVPADGAPSFVPEVVFNLAYPTCMLNLGFPRTLSSREDYPPTNQLICRVPIVDWCCEPTLTSFRPESLT